MSNTSKDRLRDDGATPPTSRAVKLAIVGVCLFVGGLLLPRVEMDFESFILAFLFMPFMMAAGLGMAIYWSIAAWRRPTLSGQDLVPESSRSIAELIAEGDVTRDSPVVPKAEKQGCVSLLLVGVIILCSMHMAFIRGLHVRTTDDWWGLQTAVAAIGGAALAALVAGLVSSLLRYFGHFKKVQTIAAVLVLCSIGFQAWHMAKRAEERAQMRLAYGLDEPLPPPMDFRIHIEYHKWLERYYPEVHDIDIDGEDWSLRYRTGSPHVPGPPNRECIGKLSPRQATKLRALMGAVRERMKAGTPLCADPSGGNLIFSLSYAGVGGEWSWDAHENCAFQPDNQNPEPGQLYELVDDIAPVWEGEERVACSWL